MEQARGTESQLSHEVIRLRERVAQLESAAYRAYNAQPEKEKRLAEVLLEIAPDGIISVNSDQIVQSFNRAAEVAFGYTADEVIGQHLDMLIPERLTKEHRQHLDRFAASGDMARRRMNERGPVLGRRKDGTEFPASASISNFQVGGEKLLVAIIRDLTEFEQIEDNIRRLPMLTEINPSPIVAFGADGMILAGNQAARRLIGKPRLIGTPLAELLGRAYELDAGVCISEGEVVTHSTNVGDKYFQFTIAGVPRINAGFVYGTDITELKKAEEELDAFAYTISHNLRAPLRAIGGFANILVADKFDQLDENAQRYLEIISENVDEMGNLIDGLLAFSRLSRQAIGKQQLDITALISQMSSSLQTNDEARRIEFNIHELPECFADPVLIKEAISNLLQNAVKFTRFEEVASIEVGYETQEGQDVYFVRDNGVGFDMKYAHNLFRVFERLHTPDEFEGTGVGLAIARNIIEKHGGSIWVDGKKDEGATFFFTLPGE